MKNCIKSLKRYSIVFIVLLFMCLLVGCNEVVPNQDKVKLYLSDAFCEHIDSEVPSFTFEFEGNLNTIKNVNKSYYTVFSNNEDDILSDALSKLFEKYKDKMYVKVARQDDVKARKYSHLDENGKLYNVTMNTDDGKVYDETAYIELENGLKLTIDYSRFISDGKTYYTWRYSASITFYVYYPLMAIDDNGTRKLVLLTLPNCTSFKVNPEQKVSSLLTKKEYLDESMYTFSYFERLDIESFDKKQNVLDYYSDYNLVKIDYNKYTFEYLNNKFVLTTKDTSFSIAWDSKVK